MISKAMVDEVKRFLTEGQLSQRKIARLTGVSRGTVGAIASGRRCDRPQPPATDEDDEPAGPPERCPVCGAMVHPPCRLCRLRKLMAAKRFPRRPERPFGPLRLELSDDHRRRYEEVRARRLLEGESSVDAPACSAPATGAKR